MRRRRACHGRPWLGAGVWAPRGEPTQRAHPPSRRWGACVASVWQVRRRRERPGRTQRMRSSPSPARLHFTESSEGGSARGARRGRPARAATRSPSPALAGQLHAPAGRRHEPPQAIRTTSSVPRRGRRAREAARRRSGRCYALQGGAARRAPAVPVVRWVRATSAQNATSFLRYGECDAADFARCSSRA